ncbi:alkyl/aryl-sulfatase [Streptomyces sp. UNOB3_S3]|uniref:alkyl/aryl-sulfatase n=1 Tax=Streptomyces sp. UNOB3_S3 TaxID=2871682 RepID=UPI001E2DD285|nr:alkyl sulfatase dimerization domain-containing protein [Streptomyces sp. UNOB3_S3]MCC3777708.1 MBL fold metallo-hydrolase [Streptomyces sp. UNOB3_S3]
MPESSEPSPFVKAHNQEVINTIPPTPGDFEDATRGLLAQPDVPAIYSKDDKSTVVWNFSAYDFLQGGDPADCPPSVNPSLWRQGLLTAVAGLFHVTSDGLHTVYQVRGYDLSNMTIITGDTGLIVIDPLASYETAQAALKLFRETTENTAPIKHVIYTHSHVDHFGGSRGLFADNGGNAPEGLRVYAPTGFLEHAISENVLAGPAMARRSEYMYAANLDKGPRGQVGAGLGLTISTGEVTLLPPTDYIGGELHQPTPRDKWSTSEWVIDWRPGLYALTIDGVKVVFQLTPGTEAPAEMNFYFPQLKALCMAENATHTMHNILSLRGAQVRDPHAWSKYLTEAIQTFGEHTDTEFASHHWPRWGKENIVEFLSNQRDMYAYLNDQALRLIDDGYTGIEIAEKLEKLPRGLAEHWYDQGYYGSLSHNLKAVYQRYIGWFDGNPAHLWDLPPVKSGVQYVAAMGGPEQVLSTARQAHEAGEYRWAAELLNHVVFATGDPAFQVDPKTLEAVKLLQADVFTQLGYGAENGTWRNFYLTGAQEVVKGPQKAIEHGASDLVRSMSLEQFFMAMAKSIDGPKAAEEQRDPIVLRWVVTGNPPEVVEGVPQPGTPDRECTVTLRNGALIYVEGRDLLAGRTDATITLSRAALDQLALSGHLFTVNFDKEVKEGVIQVDDLSVANTVFRYLTFPRPSFPIVTPKTDR